MGDLSDPAGLASAYGGAGASAALRQIVQDRIAEQLRQREAAQQQFTNARLTANDARQAEEHAATMRSLNDQRTAQQAQMQEGDAAKIAPMLSVNQSLPPMIAGRLRNTMQGANMADNPPLAQPPNVPMMQPDIVPGQQPGAVWKGTDAQRSAEDDKQKMADLQNDPNTSPQIKSFLRMRGIMPKGENIPYQLITEPNGPPKPGELKDTPGGVVRVAPDNTVTPVKDAGGKPLAAYHPPQQPIVVQMPEGPGLLNRGTGVATPVKDASGNNVGVRPSAQSERQTKAAGFALGDAQAVSAQIAAAEQAGLLGPAAGRLQGQFLAGLIGSTGNPEVDRKLGGLKAAIDNLKTSYPMAISGTARGGGGGVDRLMNVLNSDKFSADLMHGAIDEIHGALTRRTAPTARTGGAKPTAEELIKKYGGGD